MKLLAGGPGTFCERELARSAGFEPATPCSQVSLQAHVLHVYAASVPHQTPHYHVRGFFFHRRMTTTAQIASTIPNGHAP